MKKITLLLAAVLGLSALHAQTADEIASKYADAIGGKKVVGSVTSLVIESNVNAMGSDIPSTTYVLNGKGFKNEVDFNGTKIINCITDKGAWGINPMAGQASPTALPEAQAKASRGAIQIGGPLYDYAAKGYKVELAGKDAKDFQLKVSGNDANITYYVNATTYLIDKMINKVTGPDGQEREISTTFSDYKKMDNGYTMAYSQEVVYPQYTIIITHTKVEVNKAVDPSVFDMPK